MESSQELPFSISHFKYRIIVKWPTEGNALEDIAGVSNKAYL